MQTLLMDKKTKIFYTNSLSNSYETADTPRFVRPAGRPQSYAKFPQSYAEF